MQPKKSSLPPTESATQVSQPSQEPKLLPREVIPSSTNSCVDNMTLLKQTNNGQYQWLTQQYSELMNEYHFLRVNSEIMDKDTKQYLSDTLTMKRETLCSKIKFNAFQSIKEKVAALIEL